MLGNNDIDNYHPDFIFKLAQFSNSLDYQNLQKQDKEFIIKFAQRWPSKVTLNNQF